MTNASDLPLSSTPVSMIPVKGCTSNVESNLTITFRLTEHPCIFDDRTVSTTFPYGSVTIHQSCIPKQLQAIAQNATLQKNATINNVITEITRTYPCNGLIVLAINKDKVVEGAAIPTPEPKHPMLEHKHPLSVNATYINDK